MVRRWDRVRQELRGQQSQHRIRAPQVIDLRRIFRFRELAPEHPLTQATNFELVKLADKVANALGWRMRERTDSVALEIAKYVGAVRVSHV